MDRKAFLKTCGFACLGGSAMAALLQGCITAKSISGNIAGSELTIPESSFFKGKDSSQGYKPYIIIQNEQLQYPICLYRFSEDDYSALWMACTHQGAELQVFGNILECPAHGSEFSNKGMTLNGPADKPLRAFKVTKQHNQIKISLKTV